LGKIRYIFFLISITTFAQTREKTLEVLQFGLEPQILETLNSLAQMKDDSFQDQVFLLLSQDYHRNIQEAALRYFSEIRSPRAAEALPGMIEDLETWQIGQLLTFTNYLGELKIVTLNQELVKKLDSDNLAMNAAIIRLFGKLNAVEFSDKLLALLADPLAPPELTPDLITSLGQLHHTPASEEIIRIMEDSATSYALKALCLTALAEIGGTNAETAVRERLSDDNALVKASAIRAAAKIPSLSSNADIFIRALRDSTVGVRIAAAEALAEKPSASALPMLLFRAQNDPDAKVQAAALKAILAQDRGEWEKLILNTIENQKSNSELWHSSVKLALDNRLGSAIPKFRAFLISEASMTNSPLVGYLAGQISLTTWEGPDELYPEFFTMNNPSAQILILRIIQRRRLVGMSDQMKEWARGTRSSQVRIFIDNLLKEWTPVP